MKYDCELTDTFSGEANYTWVRRATFEAPDNASDKLLMRRAKKLFGMNGTRGRKDTLGESLAFCPYGACVVLFINPNY